MKTRPLHFASAALAAVLLACPAALAQKTDPAKEANAAYYTAVAHETAGDAAAAKLAYERALKLNPRHANARYRLGQLKINYDKIIAKGQERKIEDC
jgi:tetratricopeptide (TPR) repeat protein